LFANPSEQIGIVEAVILGAVQGVTEFLPISSHAHLILIPWLFGWQDPGLTFDVGLHLGTLIALLLYFRSDWIDLTISALRLLKGETDDPDVRVALYIIVGTIPAGVAGLLLEDVLGSFTSPTLIATMLIVLALFLRAAEQWGRRKIDLGTMTLADAVAIGFAQALALIPGVSRSGVTITAGLFRGMKRLSAAQFSFLLSAPIIGGAVAKKMIDVAQDGLPFGQTAPFVVGIITSAVFGFFSIAGLMRYLQTRNTYVFINYRIALGILVLFLDYFWGFQK
jgi:undecaprenyl-diphosphatase